jgi:hypothetical protein
MIDRMKEIDESLCENNLSFPVVAGRNISD